MGRYTFYILFPLVLSCERLLDEEEPKTPENFRGFFTLINDKPMIRLVWNTPIEDDIKEYHIFRAGNHFSSFDSLSMVDEPKTIFIDTSISWGQQYWYKIRTKDESTNIGSFSDSIYILAYKPVGIWAIESFDTAKLCVDPISYTTNESLRLDNDANLESIGDTSWILEFPRITIDTVTWFGSGMMHYSYVTVENSSDGIGFDTVTYSNTTAPEQFTIDFSNMNEGTILIGAEQQVIQLQHEQKSCSTVQFNFSP